MAKILAILLLGLILTGAVTATVCALPNVDEDQIADKTQTKNQLQQRNCDRNRDMTQKQERLQMRECNQNCNCIFNGPNCRAS